MLPARLNVLESDHCEFIAWQVGDIVRAASEVAVELMDLINAKRRVTCKALIGDEEQELVFAYAPNRVDAELSAKMSKAVTDDTGDNSAHIESNAEVLARLLVEWPFESNGEPLPITKENVLRLPVIFASQLMVAMVRDFSPGNSAPGSAAS